MTGQEPQVMPFNYQKESSGGLQCEKCGNASQYLYSIHDPVPHEPTRILKVCMICLKKHQEKGGDLPPSHGGGEIAGGKQE